MSCHHSHHHHSCCCHGCNTSCCSCHSSCNSSCSPQPLPISDPQNHHHLLQTLLLLQQQPLQPLKPHHRQTTSSTNKDPQLHPSLLQSLLRRIANLETTAQQQSPSPPPPQTPTPPPPNKPTIKHLAAATIQTHFRRHLARRSRTLRDLNRLAAFKSRASSLRSSLSEHSDPREASQIAMDLLSQLNSIEVYIPIFLLVSRDPMIREGKRSITRELVRVTDFVDKVLLAGKGEESGAVGGGRRDTRVRFAENGGGGEVFDELSERVFDVPEREEEDRMAHMRGHGFYELGGDDEMGLSAPLPVTMEPVRSGSKKPSSS